MTDCHRIKQSRTRNLIAVAIAMLIVLAIVFFAQPHGLRVHPHHPLDGRLPHQALEELLSYMDLLVPPATNVQMLGYRAGRGERFANVIMHEDTLASLLSQDRCRSITHWPSYIDGSDAHGIESWWTPRDVADSFIYECTFVRRPGKGAIMVDRSQEDDVVVYVYAFKP